MESEYSQWLTKDFLKKCLENEEEFREITVDSFTASAAVPPGNNFGSNILRVNLQVTKGGETEESFSLIIKAPLNNENLSDMFENEDREPVFYNEFIPQSDKLMKYSFAPKSFKSPLPSVVVLEDLKLQNFSMADRVKQLGFEHCRFYMTAAASFHAVSFALHKRNPNFINSFGTTKLFGKNNKSAKLHININKYALQSLANRIKNEEHAEIVRRSSTRLWDILVDTHKPNGSFDCLTQGDPWTTNMMFKYDEDGKVCDIKLLDFQGLSIAPSVHDVLFFLWTSANHDVRKHRVSELYKIYVDSLNEKLKYMNCSETLSYDVFMDEVKKMSPMALWAVGWMCYMLQDSPPCLEGLIKDVNQEEDANKQNPFDKFYTQKFRDNHLEQFLDELETHGVFQNVAEQLKGIHKCD